MTNIRPQLILTGVSGSGKTTVMKGLMNAYPEQYGRPIQYTTRKPRSELEKDEYVFLNYQQFLKKLINGDFVEYVEYNKELYAVGKYFDTSKTNVFIAEPVGREALKRYFKLNNIPFIACYIKCDEESIKQRLELRGSSVQELDNRLKDFKYFYPAKSDIVIDGDYRQLAVMIDVHKQVKGVL